MGRVEIRDEGGPHDWTNVGCPLSGADRQLAVGHDALVDRRDFILSFSVGANAGVADDLCPPFELGVDQHAERLRIRTGNRFDAEGRESVLHLCLLERLSHFRVIVPSV